jgi:tRNA threonylcarbamoyladenosine biosynthesis protein TsaE
VAESIVLELPDPEATGHAGGCLGRAFVAAEPDGLIAFLEGELGAGKTTFARGFLQALGHSGRVPSPTYTLIEPYSLAARTIYHIDLYRIRAPRELADLGLGELLVPGVVALIEWPGRGAGELPVPDLVVRMTIRPPGRRIELRAGSARGERVLQQMVASRQFPGPASQAGEVSV